MRNGKRILSVTIKHVVEENPDTSYLGEYSACAKGDYSIDRRHEQECNLNSDVAAAQEVLRRVASRLYEQDEAVRSSIEDDAIPVDSNPKQDIVSEISDATEFIDGQIEALEKCNCGGGSIRKESNGYS